MEALRPLISDAMGVVRHINTLAAGTIVVMAGFLSQSTKTFVWPWLLAVGLICMLFTIGVCVWAQHHLVNAAAGVASSTAITDPDRLNQVGQKVKARTTTFDKWATSGMWAFFVGLLALAIFTVRNL